MGSETETVLLFGVHGHQPQGNFPRVFRDAFEKAYRPFMEVVREFPWFSFTLHYTGPLWQWIEKEEPWFLDLVGDLVARGRVEIQVSGFYEPVLAALPPGDRLGQIEMAKEYVRSRWGVEPRGLWLTERVWEPQILPQLLEAGIEYVVVDDYHFICAGKDLDELGGYFLTEDEGRTLAIFPISEKLRYLIPFRPVDQVVDFLETYPGPGAIIHDDAEKFGVWPGTHQWVYKEGWLTRFLGALETSSIETSTFSRFMDTHPPQGRVYLPTASYFEMGEWSLPPEKAWEFHRLVEDLKARGEWDRYRPYFRGGIWKNFLVKYPEANHMHKRMLWVSRRVAHGHLRARDALYRAQCNDAYWHGIFGGLYLPHLRREVYANLLRAEVLGSIDLVGSWEEDLDADGHKEIILSNREYLAVVKPFQGGSLVELSLRRLELNITDTLARRFEHYHRGEEGHEGGSEGAPSIHELSKRLPQEGMVYDLLPRYSFMDYLVPGDFSMEAWQQGRWEGVRMLGLEAYSFQREGDGWKLVWEGEEGRVEKVYRLGDGGLGVSYRFSCPPGFTLAVGIDLHFPWAANAWVEVEGKRVSAAERQNWGRVKGWLGGDPSMEIPVAVRLDRGGVLWQSPIFTLSQSERGFDRIYQGTGFLVFLGGGEEAFSLGLRD